MFTWEEAGLLRQMFIVLACTVIAGMMAAGCWIAVTFLSQR